MKRIIFFSVLSALLTLSSCHSHQKEKEENIFLVTSAIIKDTTITQQYVSQIRSARHIEIRSQERGFLEKIYIDEGQFVHKGQLLFQIMPKIYQAEYLKAQAEVEASILEVNNAQALADKQIIAPNELALAKTKLKRAEAEMELAKTHLQFTKITAPYDGYIDHLELKLGSLVDEGELLTSLSDNSTMWVYFNVTEREYLDFKTNKDQQDVSNVQLLLANQQVFSQQGKVETIEADFNHETGNIAFRAAFPNPDNLLRNGQTGTILMSKPFKQGILIPQKATFEIMDKKYVYVLHDDETVKLTPISIKAELPDLYVVQQGLDGNEKILLEGIRKVQDGDKIKFEYEEPQQVMAKLTLPSE
ncbi:efflux RND transporter periplasmic adaptor subunit [Sphingobacterium corticibacterium]|uniref:Efflux RND transporter periplasmic adaptor subunit n=1 Tax=Sphingobacterium corticibacterium TaxID=2484746 RepID=A0A4Q6XQA5_9SPHI|nr:efflux RND transporter periplasmic adaptor subunit [Sphingobacterium corticibacterium]RZF62121.1 efflux RND transporter periplasmic adaptor subunit [Sphingobacterium corticibacterium]